MLDPKQTELSFYSHLYDLIPLTHIATSVTGQKRQQASPKGENSVKISIGTWGIWRNRIFIRETSEIVIAIQLLVMNLKWKLWVPFLSFFRLLLNLFRQP